MRINRGEQPEIKTLNSQQSDVDLFSKLEVNFLEKFFRYNLTDYFSELFVNIFEDVLDKKSTSKVEKSITSSMYIVNHGFIVEELEKKLSTFYKNKSKSVAEGQFPYTFKLKYCNRNPMPNMINSGELVFIEVKIKAEVQKIEELPDKILKVLHSISNAKKGKLSQFQKILANYQEEFISVFIVYFGDTNFNIFNKQKYMIQSIKILGREFKVRIFVFYVSKQSLIETFRTLNGLKNLEYINDLVIQFYELRREKQRRKRNRSQINSYKVKQRYDMEKVYICLGIAGLVGCGFVVAKMFL